MTNLYYTNQENYKIGDKEYPLHIVEGIRSRGKTTYWITEAYKHYRETGQKFIYLRRSTIELTLALNAGIFTPCRQAYSDVFKGIGKEKCRNNSITLNINGVMEEVGYYYDLNNIKGIAIEDSDLIIFDEYVASSRTKYKGGEYGANEAQIFAKLCETVFRSRNFTAILLGNNDTPTNPYNEFFHIPFGTKYYKNKNVGVFYYFDYSEETVKKKQDTSLIKIFGNTSYGDYTCNGKSLDEINEDFISEVPSKANRICTIKFLGSIISVLSLNNIFYLTDKYKVDKNYPILSATTSDLSVDSNFIKTNMFLLIQLKIIFGEGRMRFNSQKTANTFMIIASFAK